MFLTPSNDLGGKEISGRREDLSFIVRFNWKTSNHLKEAIQVLLAARLDKSGSFLEGKVRTQSDVLDENEFWRIRYLIASNPNTPAEVLCYLSRHCGVEILMRIAENPRATAEILSDLALNADACVRASVAENLNTPPDVLAVLCADEDVDVRFRLAENANLPPPVLERLAEDINPYVSHRAQNTLARLENGELMEVQFPNNDQWGDNHQTAFG